MADLDVSIKKINDLTAQAEASEDDLLAVGNNETGLLKKITVKNHAESIKNTIIGESEEISDIADGTVVGAIKQFDSDIPETQGIITEAFSETESYAVGDVCIYENKLYTFKEAKDAGEWDSEIVEETTVDKLLNQKNDLVSDAFDETKTYSAGDYCIYNNTLYKFKEEKTAGEWDDDPELVEAVTVMGELNSALADLPSIQYGSFTSDSLTAGTVYSESIIFTKAFSSQPHVFCSCRTGSPSATFASVNNVSATGFTLYYTRTSGTAGLVVSWMAIGTQ